MTEEEKEKKEDWTKDTKDKEEEDGRESIKTLADEEEDYFDYSDSDHIYEPFVRKSKKYNIIEECALTLLRLRIYLLKTISKGELNFFCTNL